MLNAALLSFGSAIVAALIGITGVLTFAVTLAQGLFVLFLLLFILGMVLRRQPA